MDGTDVTERRDRRPNERRGEVALRLCGQKYEVAPPGTRNYFSQLHPEAETVIPISVR